MKAYDNDKRVGHSLFSLRSYLIFFVLVASIVSCCFLLFLNTLQAQLGVRFSQEEIAYAAKITFANVALLSFICTLIDGVRRKLTVQRPVKRILQATHRLTQGDFSARIQPLHSLDSQNEFDIIIEDFNKMAQELSGIETLRTDFIANVSHELKTPLAVMQSYATMLQAPDLSPAERAEYAKAITNATRRLSELVTNILKLNKLENQQIFPEWTQFDICEQLCQCILHFEDVWENKNLQIVTKLEEPAMISGDAELLVLVWNNLISNAIKFTDNGGTIAIELHTTPQLAIVSISDTGCGISQDIGQHIFEKFYQGDSSHTTQGNGLGLALVRRVIDIMGGDISVESSEGKGSTFVVQLCRDRL